MKSKRKKVIRRVLLLLLIPVMYAFIVLGCILSSLKDVPAAKDPVLIVLGAQVKGDPAAPSPVLYERLKTAAAYLKEHPSSSVIVCGGQGADESNTEAAVMKDTLINLGIEDERVQTESTSKTTIENLENAKKMTTSKNVVIVTNDFHMFRAKLIARRVGFTSAEGLSAPTTPSAIPKCYAREIAALGYHLIFSH